MHFAADFLRLRLPWLAAAVIVVFSGRSPVHAAIVANAANDMAHRELAAVYDGKVVSVNFVYPPGSSYAPAAASGTIINRRFVLTAKHVVTQVLPFDFGFQVSTGRNFLDARETIRNVTRWVLHPDPLIDLAILELESEIPEAIPARYGVATARQILAHVGFGIFGDPTTADNPIYDGHRRAFRAPARTTFGGFTGYTDEFNFETEFRSDNPDPLCGKGLSSDSGSGVFDSNGIQVGTAVYQAGGWNYGSTGIIDLGLPQIQSWIASTTAPPPGLHCSLAGASMRLNWDAAAAGFRLQASGDLSTWTDLSSVLSGPGTFDDPVADRHRRFYRLIRP